MARATGTTLVTLVKFLRSQRERALVALPPSLHGYLDERIHVSTWYPEADLLALMRAMLGMLPGARETVLAQMGVALAREHLEGIYGHLKLDAHGDPATLARRSFALWGSQHDTGTFHIEIERPGRARLDVRVVKRACRLDGGDICSWSAEWGV